MAIGGDYAIAGAHVPTSSGHDALIIACKLEETGKLPDAVG